MTTSSWVDLPVEEWPEEQQGYFCEECGEETPRCHLVRGLCDACIASGFDYDPEESYDYDGSPLRFAGPGSALRAASKNNPRNLPCPTCGVANRLTSKDRELGYQCDSCADRAERGGW